MTTTLVLGGQRSGKSHYAESLALASGGSLIYIATAQAWDDEMRDRIARHQERRGDSWKTVNEPLEVVPVLRQSAGPGRFVLLDCLTLWLSNLMHADRDVGGATTELVDALENVNGPVALVSNEVGSGIIPDNALARRFADAQGILNQAVARSVAHVVLMAAGIPLQIKPATAAGA